MAKVKRVVLGEGSFDYCDFGKSIGLWTMGRGKEQSGTKRKTFPMGKLRRLECKRVRLVAEVLDGR